MKTIRRRSPEKLLAGLFLVVMISACGRAAAPAENVKGPVQAATPGPVDPWTELVKAAQKEGNVTIYATAISPAIQPLSDAFRQKFGINLDFVQGRGPEVVVRLTAERRAGLYLADAGHFGEMTSLVDIKSLGVTTPLPDLLVLPEVKNPGNWVGGKLPLLDKDQHAFMALATAIRPLVINTDMVKEGDITSFMDLLNPRWKGKIVFSDPTVAGSSPYILAAMVKTFGQEKAYDAFRQLATPDLALTRDQRQQLEWVARGKYPIGLGYSVALFSEFHKAGAPMKMVSFKEPRHISSGPGTVTVFSKSANPKATQLYLNWLLSKEGSSLFARAVEYPSTRTDVNNDFVDADAAPRATDYFPDENFLQLASEMRKVSEGIFGPLVK